MTVKEFEVKKGKGKNAAIFNFTAKNEEDVKKLGIFLYCGWSVKEVKKA